MNFYKTGKLLSGEKIQIIQLNILYIVFFSVNIMLVVYIVNNLFIVFKKNLQ